MIIQELLTENIVRDYYTANIKAGFPKQNTVRLHCGDFSGNNGTG